MTDNFTHLHVHTEYSVLDGINRVSKLPQIVKDMGQTALAMTDHGTIAGAYQHVKECRKVGIKPILGMEAYYCVNDRSMKEKDEEGSKYYHLILLAQNNTGWKNLMALSSGAYNDGLYYKPRLDDALLAEHSEGIIATTACLGSRFSKLLLLGRREEAIRLIDGHNEMFSGRFFAELQLHEDPEQRHLNEQLLSIAAEKNIPILLTNDAHYTHKEHKSLHEQALCMQTNDVMHNPKRFTFGPIDVHVGSYEWMKEQAEAKGIPYEAISNTQVITDMIDSESYFMDILNRYPKYPYLPKGISAWQELEYLAKTKLIERMGGKPPPEYRARLEMELLAIKRLGFSDYMLIVQHFVNTAREQLDVYVGPGRGSAAGSLVAYALGITQVDPIKYGLLFERFLNPGRGATPVIFSKEALAQLNQY